MALLSASDLGVSRETHDRFSIFVELLLKWNAKINLIGRTTEEQVWQRHVFDCAQVATFGPKGGSWADFGAGAGLPGLIIAAINLEKRPLSTMTLVESDTRKCAFLAAAAQAMDLDVSIISKRIELVTEKYDVITARALAPLADLLLYARDRLAHGGQCVFLKGAKYADELASARVDWTFTEDIHPSIASADAAVLIIRDIERQST